MERSSHSESNTELNDDSENVYSTRFVQNNMDRYEQNVFIIFWTGFLWVIVSFVFYLKQCLSQLRKQTCKKLINVTDCSDNICVKDNILVDYTKCKEN